MSVCKFLTLSYKEQRTLSTALQVECNAMVTKMIHTTKWV